MPNNREVNPSSFIVGSLRALETVCDFLVEDRHKSQLRMYLASKEADLSNLTGERREQVQVEIDTLRRIVDSD